MVIFISIWLLKCSFLTQAAPGPDIELWVICLILSGDGLGSSRTRYSRLGHLSGGIRLFPIKLTTRVLISGLSSSRTRCWAFCHLHVLIKLITAALNFCLCSSRTRYLGLGHLSGNRYFPIKFITKGLFLAQAAPRLGIKLLAICLEVVMLLFHELLKHCLLSKQDI